MMMLGLDLTNRRVAVVGGGAVAERRVRSLLTAGAAVSVVAPVLTEHLRQLAGDGHIEVHARPFESGDVDDAWLVIAATDSDIVNQQVAEAARERRVWCVHSADGAAGSARMVAQSTLADMMVGVVSTAAADPRRSVDVLEQILGCVEAGTVQARDRRPGAGKVTLVGAGPGAADLITVRGRHALAQADVIIADRLGTEQLLATAPEGASIIDVGKSPGHHPVPQAQINQLILDHAAQGKRVVRLKGGDPYVLGRGGEEVHACLTAGVAVEVVPGITSALAGPLLAGIPVTQRGLTHALYVSSGHAGADPTMMEAARGGVTVVLLMAVAALEDIVTTMLDGGIDPTTPVAIVERAATAAQRLTQAPLSRIVAVNQERSVTNPAIVVVGAVAAPGLLASDLAATPEVSP